jgi:CelD/BcsL family acetyltransferase involved in cellulose biosynthesis
MIPIPRASGEPERECFAFPGEWTAEVHRGGKLPADVTDEWNRLAAACGDRGLFVSPAWFEQWWRVFGRDAELFAVVMRKRGSVKGIFPCLLSPQPGGRLHLGVPTSEAYFDFVLDEAEAGQQLALFVSVLERKRGFLPGEFGFLSTTHGHGPAFERLLRQRRFPIFADERGFGPLIDLSQPAWEAVEATLHSKLKNNIRKGRRRAEREGPLLLEVVSTEDRLQETLTEAIAIERSGWKGERGTPIADDPLKDAYYRSLAAWAASEGRLYLAVLRHNQKMVAFDLCIRSGKTIYAVKTGYDQAAARFSAGNIMRLDSLRRMHGTGVTSYDLLGLYYGWKTEWTSVSDRCRWLVVYPNTVGGWWQYCRRHGWKAPLKRSKVVKALVHRARGSRSLTPQDERSAE